MIRSCLLFIQVSYYLIVVTTVTQVRLERPWPGIFQKGDYSRLHPNLLVRQVSCVFKQLLLAFRRMFTDASSEIIDKGREAGRVAASFVNNLITRVGKQCTSCRKVTFGISDLRLPIPVQRSLTKEGRLAESPHPRQ